MNKRINSTDKLIDVPFNVQTLLVLQEQAELLEKIAYKLGDMTVVEGFQWNDVDKSRTAGTVVYNNKIIPTEAVNAGDNDNFELINGTGADGEVKVTTKAGNQAVFYKKYFLKQKADGGIKGSDFEHVTTLKNIKGPKYLATISIDVANLKINNPASLTSADAKVTIENGLGDDIKHITIKKLGVTGSQHLEFNEGRNYRFEVFGSTPGSGTVMDYTIRQDANITKVYGKSWEMLTTNMSIGNRVTVRITKLY